jgi:hypothetical protein
MSRQGYPIEVINKACELRKEGKTYQAIATLLNIHKNTVVKWLKDEKKLRQPRKRSRLEVALDGIQEQAPKKRGRPPMAGKCTRDGCAVPSFNPPMQPSKEAKKVQALKARLLAMAAKIAEAIEKL